MRDELISLGELEPGMACIDYVDRTIDIIIAIEYLRMNDINVGGYITYLAQEGFVYTDYMVFDNVRRVRVLDEN